MDKVRFEVWRVEEENKAGPVMTGPYTRSPWMRAASDARR
jgi:hypothetical protein